MFSRVKRWLGSVIRHRRWEREMQEEMGSHLLQSAARLTARGMSEPDAREAARREFGNVALLQEQSRDARGTGWIEATLGDLRFAVRHFARTPFVTLTMVALLALGIGLNSALFMVLDSFVNMPPPGIGRHANLVRLRGVDRSGGTNDTRGREFSYPEFQAYTEQRNLFSAVTAWTSADVVLQADGRELESGAATYVAADYFEVLGVRIALGTGLPTTTVQGEAELVAVISDAVWDKCFARDPNVVNRVLHVNGVSVRVVGVTPRQFAGTRSGGSRVRIWLPLNARAVVQGGGNAGLASVDSTILSLAARLQPGIEPGQMSATVRAIATQFAQQTTRWSNPSTISAEAVPLLANNYHPPSGGDEPNLIGRLPVLILPLLILLIPCTNVSGLLVGLALNRQREIGVRLSLGASRQRLVRQLLTEFMVFALAAGVVGLAIIGVFLKLFGARVTDFQLGMRWPLFLFTFGVAALACLIFGISPALHATRVGIATALNQASGVVGSTRTRLQSGLVVAQIALTQPLLLGMGALVLDLTSDRQRNPSIPHADRILQVGFNTAARDAPAPSEQLEQFRRLREQFGQLPGVVSVVAQSHETGFVPVTVHPEDRVADSVGSERLGLETHGAPPGYFALMGFPFTRGQEPDNTVAANSRALVIRSDLAQRLWGSSDPIGRRLVLADSNGIAFVVVGVVDANVAGRSGIREARGWVPALTSTQSLLIRTVGPASRLIPTVRSVAHSVAPRLAITNARTVAAQEAEQRSSFRKAIAGVVGGGLVALLLAAIGLYAAVALAVSQRLREIGIRTAMGADAGQVVRMFFLRGLRLSAVGLSIGLALSLVVMRLLALSRGEAAPRGVGMVAVAVGIVVLAVAALATWVPARRAASVDPLTSLRVE